MNLSNIKIAIIGLGYVGLPLAVEFGKQRPVLGFDINVARIAELQSGQDGTLEVTSDDLRNAKQLGYSSNLADLADCGIFIVTVPTPIDKANRPDLTPLIKASETVGKALKSGAVVIYESTVYPGCTEEVCVPVLEKFSGLKFNHDFFCGYSPERINPGDTHPEVTRYFMTITEATQLVLQAAAMARGGDVFVLDMGEPVKIIDLARRLVNLAGLKVRDAQHPEGDIDLAIIGLRPGEKLYEELLIGDNPSATAHSRIMVAHEDYMLWPALESQLTQLRQAAIGEDEAAIRSVLQACVHGFHQEPDTS